MDSVATENVLVVSDLHLGEDRVAGEIDDEEADRSERALVEFLDHYRAHRQDGAPWRVIVNGDMVDFLGMCVMPSETGELLGLHPDDHLYGLGGTRAASTAKMRVLLNRHPELFRAIARFLADGNTMAVVMGNHDAELWWPEVQDLFRQRLAAEGVTPERLAAALTFHPWFFYEKDLAWVEHGHQYDPYCSNDAILDPYSDEDGELELTVSGAAMHYLSNHYRPHADGEYDLGFWGYLHWTFVTERARARDVLGAFVAMNVRVLSGWATRTRNPEIGARRRRRHLERLRELARRVRLPVHVLLRLDAMRRRPVTHHLAKLLPALMLDRLILLGVSMFLATLAVVTLPWGWLPAALLALVGALLGLDVLLGRRRESLQPQPYMRRVARRIRRLVRAPIVVFGHAHDVVAERHDDGGWYFNTGTWVSTPKDALKRAFTHLRILRTAAGPRAELCRWDGLRSEVVRP